MESKFLNQDVDVVFLANKGIVIGFFVGMNYNKILIETRKLTDKIRVTKNGLGPGVDRMLKSSDSALYLSPIDVIHSETVSSSTSSFLAYCLAYASHAPMIISEFWCHENETCSLNFGPLLKRSLIFFFLHDRKIFCHLFAT